MNIWQALLDGLFATTWLEFIAVVFGITSVVLSRKEHIGVYPTGIINTTIYIYLSIVAGLYAEAGVNVYYTIMSIMGWVWWSRKTQDGDGLRITQSDGSEWLLAMGFFLTFWGALYWVLSRFTDSTVPVADGFASATAYTGMWLMARKKLENWLWWIATNIASIPLYFIKGFVFTSFQYLVFLALAVWGYVEWRRKLQSA
ncbi:MAG: nicotinamide mononucleotide transporter [Chitinophagales bacterium]|nr:nicotinamide mononucleotide transporter [Chitinophagales bacterium]